MASINHLPTEILVHIFSFYAYDTPQGEVVRILGSVCSRWNTVLNNPQFWKIFDGSVSFEHFQWLCKNGLLKNTEDVTFSSVQNLSNKDLKCIFNNIRNVKIINFSKLGKWSNNIFLHLDACCPKVCEIVMSDKNTSRDKYECSGLWFEQFLKIRGSMLTKLVFSDSWLVNVRKLLIDISRTCPNLQQLCAINLDNRSSQITFPISEFQQGCPRLKSLLLGYPFVYSTRASKPYPGFSELEVFSHSNLLGFRGFFSDDCFQKLLFQSEKLELLNLSGVDALSSYTLLSLPCKNLGSLRISQSGFLSSRHLPDVLTRWRHSLMLLDVSVTDSEQIDDVFINLVSGNGMPCINTLFINYTKLGPHALKEIILNCPTLRFLQLHGCTKVGRGLMRTYHSRMEIDRLLDVLENPSLVYPYTDDSPEDD